MIEHPFRTTISTDPSDIDGICGSLESVKEEISKLRDYESLLRYSLSRISLDETKTRRVKGERYVAVLTSPDDYWSQSEIKKIKEHYPSNWFEAYFRIATYAPNLREIKKVENTTGEDKFERLKRDLLACRTTNNGPPSVKIERIGDK